MYELIKAGENTYYINCPSKMGVYNYEDNKIVLVDTGNNKYVGKKILKIVNENNWELKYIINTHSHADHIGGNDIITKRTDAKIIASSIEEAFIENTILEPSFLYGGNPIKKLKNKLLMAKASDVYKNIKDVEIPGIDIVDLPGHSFNMIGVKTADNITFIADSVFSENTINKYHLFYLYDVQAYLNTLETLENMQSDLFVPSHAEATTDISKLTSLNRNKIKEISNTIISLCKDKITFENLLAKLFEHYNLTMDINQQFLVGTSLKGYITYLMDNGKIDFLISENLVYYFTRTK